NATSRSTSISRGERSSVGEPANASPAADGSTKERPAATARTAFRSSSGSASFSDRVPCGLSCVLDCGTRARGVVIPACLGGREVGLHRVDLLLDGIMEVLRQAVALLLPGRLPNFLSRRRRLAAPRRLKG